MGVALTFARMMEVPMERRDFLKASAMSAASAAVLARTVSANAPDALDPAIGEQVGSGVTR